MLFRSYIATKALRFSLAMSCGLWLAGYALAEQPEGVELASLSAQETFALIQSCANSDESADTKLQQRCDAYQTSIATIMKSTLNRWIELETHKANLRVYVAIPDQADPFSLNNRRIHLREDTDGWAVMDQVTQRRYPPTVVRLTLRVYDKNGKLELSKDVEQPKAESILHFYQSPLRLVCSKEYLTPFIPNGEQLITMQKAEDVRKSKTIVPNWVVAVPK